MAERSVEINLTGKSDAALIEAIPETRAEKKAKLVSVLSRSVVTDRLSVDLPKDTYGEWFPNDKMEIYRAQMMGFSIDTQYAKNRSLHETGNAEGASVVADAIFMTCPLETKQIIDEIKQEQYDATHRDRKGKQKEERDFEAETQNVGLPSEMKSRLDSTSVDDIRAAMTST